MSKFKPVALLHTEPGREEEMRKEGRERGREGEGTEKEGEGGEGGVERESESGKRERGEEREEAYTCVVINAMLNAVISLFKRSTANIRGRS